MTIPSLLPAPPAPGAAGPVVLAARGRPTGRGRPRGTLLHAVPVRDRTRTALCGERVGGPSRPWPGSTGADAALVPDPRACPECAAVLDR